jgi:hypothetical protein
MTEWQAEQRTLATTGASRLETEGRIRAQTKGVRGWRARDISCAKVKKSSNKWPDGQGEERNG